MDVHEYQAKELLAQFGVPVPKGAVAFSPDQAVYAATELGGWNWAVKARFIPGARGKAGGIKLCKTYHEVREAAADMLGKRLVTIRTGPEGKPVQRVYIEVAEPFEREIYLGYVLDRKAERIRVIASRRGGMEIEEIARTEPDEILQVLVEPAVGLQAFQARQLAFAPRPQHQAGAARGDHDHERLSRVPRSRRDHARDQSAGGDQGRPRDRARRQDDF